MNPSKILAESQIKPSVSWINLTHIGFKPPRALNWIWGAKIPIGVRGSILDDSTIIRVCGFFGIGNDHINTSHSFFGFVNPNHLYEPFSEQL
jgi:hypothetical protein